MAIMKSVTTAEKLIQKVIADRDRKTAEAQQLIQETEKTLLEIEDRIDKAAKDGDADAFRQARKDRLEVLELQELYNRQNEALSKRQLITKEDYERTIKDIFAEYDAKQLCAKEKLAKLAEQMADIAEELDVSFQEANVVLKLLQHDVYMDADRMKHPRTGECLTAVDMLGLKDRSAIQWGKIAKENFTYSEYIRSKS